MGLWQMITGRSQPVRPDLDALFALPTAALTLQSGLGLSPVGTGSVCFRAPAGAAYAQTQREIEALVNSDPEAPRVRRTDDEFGFAWLVVDGADEDMSTLCSELHAVNTSLELQGFAEGLLCTVVPFADPTGRRVGLVYLYKQGTFYPFAPGSDRTRDTLLEYSVADALTGELPMETDRGRQLPLWGAPGW